MKFFPAARLFFTLTCAPWVNCLLLAEESAQTEITSTSLEMWSTDTETFATFLGNVVVTGTDLKLTCDRLDVTTSRLGDKTATIAKLDKFKYMLAKGKVHIVQGDREATCGRAEVLPREDKIILTEDPVAVDRSNSWTGAGDIITLFRGQRRAKVDNPRFTLPPIKDLGFDKNETPPTTETSASTAHPTEKPEKPKAESVPTPAGPSSPK